MATSMHKQLRAFIIVCLFTSVRSALPDGYTPSSTPGVAYKLMYECQRWQGAKRACEADGAKLAVPKSQVEFDDLQRIVLKMNFFKLVDPDYKLIVWLGVNNLENYKEWKTIECERFADNPYNQWAEGNGNTVSDDSKDTHCAGVDSYNPGLRDWWCHYKLAFICQLDTN